MFMIDTGMDGGSLGPWLRWTSEGSARKRLEPESWSLRSKDAAGNTVETNIPAFKNGCVMDLDTLKLGWEKENTGGGAPERRWNPSISQSTQRPDESKKAGGGYMWSNALSVRVAVSRDQAATWEQGGFGSYEAFTRLSKIIMAEWAEKSQNGRLLPVVVQSGLEQRKLTNGTTSIPILTISKWVERPDCLKADAPKIETSAPASETGLTRTSAPVQQPASAPAGAEF